MFSNKLTTKKIDNFVNSVGLWKVKPIAKLKKEEIDEMQQQGMDVTDLWGSVNELEVELAQEAESDSSVTYLETLQNKFVGGSEEK